MKKNGLFLEKIYYCVCIYGYSDYVGNLSMFDKVVYILFYDVCEGDKYYMYDFKMVGFFFVLFDFVIMYICNILNV